MKAQATPSSETTPMPPPNKGHMWVQVPEDLQRSAITSSAIATLCRIGNGDLVAELTEDIEELVSKCMSLGKKGSVSLKLSVAPDTYKKLAIKPKIELKAPKMETEFSILFATPNGQLLTRDPDQMEMDLKVVQISEGKPARKID